MKKMVVGMVIAVAIAIVGMIPKSMDVECISTVGDRVGNVSGTLEDIAHAKCVERRETVHDVLRGTGWYSAEGESVDDSTWCYHCGRRNIGAGSYITVYGQFCDADCAYDWECENHIICEVCCTNNKTECFCGWLR